MEQVIQSSSSRNDFLYSIADQVLPGAGLGGYALPKDLRFVFEKGQGARIWDVDGREYIDYVGGAGAQIMGHSHPKIIEAVNQQMVKGSHMFGTLNEPAILLAGRLVEDIPCAQKIVYATTGSEATSYAMRLARAFTGKDMILKFEGAYHGNHDYALTSTFPKILGNDFHGQDDTAGRPEGMRSTMCVAPYNDREALEYIVKENKENLAAIIVEPVQRIIPARYEFLQDIRRICLENNLLMILDEVVCGFRLAYGGAQEYYEIIPDLATYGKIIGAGGPLAVVAGRSDVLDLCDPRRKGEKDYVYFNGTLHGNPPAAVATLSLLDILSKADPYQRLNQYAGEACKAFQEILDHYSIRAKVQNTGSLWQILFMEQSPNNHKDILDSDLQSMNRFDRLCMKNGFYALPGVRRFFSLVHGKKELEDSLKILDRACQEFTSY